MRKNSFVRTRFAGRDVRSAGGVCSVSLDMISGSFTLLLMEVFEESQLYYTTPQAKKQAGNAGNANICQKTPKKVSRPSLLSHFTQRKSPKKPFSVFEWSALPKVGENERTPFVFYSNPNRIENPIFGTRFETVCGRFYTNLHVFPLSLLRLKRIVGPGKNATFRNALYFRYMVVLIESARILRLSSNLSVVASTQKRRISTKAGPGRLRESAN